MTKRCDSGGGRPRLTVVTAVYNAIAAGRGEMLRRCLESVRGQSVGGDIEHIVIDGASSDGTRELLEKYAARGWIRLVSKSDRGVYEAMNTGLAEARGEYVLFLNSDDRFHSPRAVDAALKAMERSGADYGFGDAVVYDERGRFEAYWIGSLYGIHWALNYCHQTMLVRTEVLRGYGGFDLGYSVSADSHLMLRMFRDGRPYAHVAAFMVDYAMGGMSAVRSEQARLDHARAYREVMGCECPPPPPKGWRWYRLGWRGLVYALLTKARRVCR